MGRMGSENEWVRGNFVPSKQRLSWGLPVFFVFLLAAGLFIPLGLGNHMITEPAELDARMVKASPLRVTAIEVAEAAKVPQPSCGAGSLSGKPCLKVVDVERLPPEDIPALSSAEPSVPVVTVQPEHRPVVRAPVVETPAAVASMKADPKVGKRGRKPLRLDPPRKLKSPLMLVSATPQKKPKAGVQNCASSGPGLPGCLRKKAMAILGTAKAVVDYEKSLWMFQEAALLGDAVSAYNAGQLLRKGQLGEPEPEIALTWYRLAAEAGFAPAQFNLGLMYIYGEGVAQNLREGGKWMEKAALAGNARAQDILKKITPWRG